MIGLSRRGSDREKAASSNPNVALPAMVRLGWLQEFAATADTGWRNYLNGREFLPAGHASNLVGVVTTLYGPSPWATVPAQGTMAAVFSEYAGAGTATGVLLGMYNAGTARAKLSFSSGKVAAVAVTSSLSAQNAPQNTQCVGVARWDAAGIYLNKDGTEATAGAAPTTGLAIDRLYVGLATTDLIRLGIWSAAKKTNGWVANLSQSAGQAVPDTMTIVRQYLDPGDVFTLLNGDSKFYQKQDAAGQGATF
jgi:hypothetical protein